MQEMPVSTSISNPRDRGMYVKRYYELEALKVY